ncbi:acyltransferase family protein [Sphingomonas sp. Xoc002]|uniref:acyltransferase family protein n=1 Tax=Sphingomonas sp. Xoc002 TaxID=2837624 RepID=UPI003D185FB1
MRAIAILAVVLFHYDVGHLANGYLGVDIFFVISGFLITSDICRRVGQSQFSYLDFYRRRARRLVPALVAVIIPSTLFAMVFMTPYELKVYAVTAISTIFGISNFAFLGFVDYFSPKATRQLLMMAWSLSVEQQFYLMLPPLIVGIVPKGRHALAKLFAVILAVSFAAATAFEWYRPDAAFYLLPFRAWEFAAGAWLATVDLTSGETWISRRFANGLAVSGAVLLGSALVMTYPVSVVVLRAMAVLGSMALIAAPRSVVNRHMLGTKPGVVIGRYSYSWYLWHWPPLAAMNLLGIDLGPMTRIGFLIATFAIAMISYALVEQPLRRSRPAPLQPMWRHGAVLGAVVILLAAIDLSGGLSRFASPALREADRDVRGAMSNPCLTSYGDSTPSEQLSCLPVSGRPAVAVVGDSHANSLVAGVRQIAQRRSLAIYQMTKSSCQPIIGYSRVLDRYPMHHRECAAFMARVLSTVAAHPEIRILVLAGYWSSFVTQDRQGMVDRPSDPARREAWMVRQRQALAVGLRHTAEVLRKMGRQVVIVQDVPHFAIDPYGVALADIMPQRALVSNWLDADPKHEGVRDDRLPRSRVIPDQARGVLAQVARQVPGVTLFDPTPALCSETGCRFRHAGHILYGDAHHLSRAGAVYATRTLRLPN